MSLKRIEFRDWIFDVDVDATELLYSSIESGDANSCECGNCKYFISIRDSIYPNEIIDLFNKFGIDSRKETHLTDCGYDDIEHLYWIGFNFIGKMINGMDCSPLIDGTAVLTQMTTFDRNFEIGFTKHISSAMFAHSEDLMEIELFVKTPVVINNN